MEMIKKVLVVLVALFLSVVLFELFLRYSPFSYGLSPVVYDKDIGMWHKKNFSSNAIRECYNTEYYFDKNGLVRLNYNYNENKKDVLIFGDSFIEANWVKNENIIHNVLWRAYRGSYNFINYGLSGTSPTQQFVILTKKAKLDNVKTVLQIISIDNDIYDVDPHNAKMMARPKVNMKFLSLEDFIVVLPREQNLKDKIMDIIGNFQLYVPIKKVIYIIKNTINEVMQKNKNKREKVHEAKIEDLSNNWLQIEGAIYQTKKFLDTKNIHYKILINSNKDENIDHLSNILNTYSISFLDLRDINLSTFSCDRHWDDLAHQNIAKLLYKSDFIKKESENK